ncbi:MAG TPA: cysteine dioxygenase family protein [Acidimicrobiales bacterium]|nr:cysteine dioxygenase family protein [Acidimicrobiales bacterium]
MPTYPPPSPELGRLVRTVEEALVDPTLADEQAQAEAIRPALAAVLARPDAVPPGAEADLAGQAVGNLLHADPSGRFHVLAVVFPAGTSSGVHHHGCWGVIGYLRGGDEETRYRAVSDGGGTAVLEESEHHVWHAGDITYLLPEHGQGWHRVRNPGPGPGVSIHVLCRLPSNHPHRYWDRATGRVSDYPFVEVAPGRWRASLTDRP